MIQHPYSGPTYFCILFPPAIKPKNFVCRNTENMSDRMQILHTFDTSDRIRKRRLLAFPMTEEKVCSKKREQHTKATARKPSDSDITWVFLRKCGYLFGHSLDENKAEGPSP